MRAFYGSLTAMTCILHGEMRISLKILNMILIEGHSNWLDGILHSSIGDTGPDRLDRYTCDIENTINIQILGDNRNPSQ